MREAETTEAGRLKRALAAALTAARRELGPVAALLVVVLGVFIFLRLSGEVREGETSGLDVRVLLALRHPPALAIPIGPSWLVSGATDLSSLGSPAVLTLVLVLVCGLFLGLGHRREALTMAAAALSGMLLSEGLKMVFGRARPPEVFHAVKVVSASFPSGHAMLSAVVYLTLGALVARFASRRGVKAYALGAGLVATLIVGLTRIYLGVHWLTDVLGGWLAGSAWAMLWWLAVWVLDQRSAGRARPMGSAT